MEIMLSQSTAAVADKRSKLAIGAVHNILLNTAEIE